MTLPGKDKLVDWYDGKGNNAQMVGGVGSEVGREWDIRLQC